MKKKIGIKGVWLPGEVAFNNELTEKDKFVWWVIDSLDCTEDNCWASNEYIAYLLDVNPQTISNSVRKLKEKDYIKQVSFDGRVRRLKRNDTYFKKYRHLVDNYNNKLNKEKPDFNPQENLNPKQEPKKSSEEQSYSGSVIEPEDYSEDVQSLFEFWQDLKIVVHRKSKARDQALDMLNTKSQHYPVQIIKRAMQTYKDLLDNPYNILKPNLPYKVGLDEFFGFSQYTKDVIKKSYKKLQIRSWFNECLKGGEYLEKYDCLRKDDHPNVTKKLKKEYSQIIKHLPETLSAIEENSFRKASCLLVEFIKKHDKKLRVPIGDIRNPVQFVKYVFEYFERRNIEEMNSGWLCSDFFYDSFTAWMKKQGYL